MLGIVFVIMLIILLYRAGILGLESPALTTATYIAGITTAVVTVAVSVITRTWAVIDVGLAVIILVVVFLLKPLVRKMLDLYDLHNQVKPDDRDRIYTKYETFGDDNNDDFDNFR
ncbi:MAG: hypothetical protein J1F28_11010 [Oscillospiraceae bacterium]|nr:hypothetical protein [Oscillospiraceae bacterium]